MKTPEPKKTGKGKTDRRKWLNWKKRNKRHSEKKKTKKSKKPCPACKQRRVRKQAEREAKYKGVSVPWNRNIVARKPFNRVICGEELELELIP